MVYILSFDSLYDYVQELEMRNRAFTSISRSKGWVRISGVGKGMERAREEIERILREIPFFNFKFPEPSKIRSLDASETFRRKKEVRDLDRNVKDLLSSNKDALSAVDREKLRKLRELLGEID